MRPLALLITLAACEARRIDLAPPVDDQAAACVIAPCEPGTSRCDLVTPSLRLTCVDGCLVPSPCEAGQSCSSERPGECDAIECKDLGNWELLQVCNDASGICDRCGPCADCTGFQSTEPFCAPRPGGTSSVLTCQAYCFAEQPCGDGGCVTGLLNQIAACADTIDCDVAGCTNVPVCGSSECGPCGCCTADDIGNPELCWWGPDGRSEARYIRNGSCYDVEVCPRDSYCDFDTQGKTGCISF